MGLGLAITQRICDLFNCEMAITSEQGAGTIIAIVIPLHNTVQLAQASNTGNTSGRR
jgi:signal transduction histidine kinase